MSGRGELARAQVELQVGVERPAFIRAGSRLIYQYWYLLRPHCRLVFLAPQVSADESRVLWNWSEAAGAPPPSATELAEVRTRLADANWSLMENEPEDTAAGASSIFPELRARVAAIIAELTKKSDAGLAGFVARTQGGLLLHSWGALSPGRPYFPDALECEVSGLVVVQGTSDLRHDVVLEDARGAGVARTRSNDAGAFRFPKVAPGQYRVRVLSDQVDFPVTGVSIRVDRESITGLELRSSAKVDSRSSAANAGLAGLPDEPTRETRPNPRFSKRKSGVIALLLLCLGGGVFWWLRIQRIVRDREPERVEARTLVLPDETGVDEAAGFAKGRSRTSEAPIGATVVPAGRLEKADRFGREETATEDSAAAEGIAGKGGGPGPADATGVEMQTAPRTPPPAAGNGVVRVGAKDGGLPITVPDGPGGGAAGSGNAEAGGSAATPPAVGGGHLAMNGVSPGLESGESASLVVKTLRPVASAALGAGTEITPPPRASTTLAPEAGRPGRKTDSTETRDSADPAGGGKGRLAAEPKPDRDNTSNSPRGGEIEPSPAPLTVGTPADLAGPGRRLHWRVSPWECRLLEDVILPTQPMRVGQSDTTETLRERFLQERKRLLPTTLGTPVTWSGFALEGVDLGSSDREWRWEALAGAVLPSGFVRNGRAEIAWSGPVPAGGFAGILRAGDGRVLARVRVPEKGDAVLETAPKISGWPWVGVEQANADGPAVAASRGGQRFEWRVPGAATLPTGWSRDDAWLGGRGHRLDLKPTESAGATARSLALADRRTGWALVSRIELR